MAPVVNGRMLDDIEFDDIEFDDGLAIARMKPPAEAIR